MQPVMTENELYELDLADFKFLFEAGGSGQWPALSNAVKYCYTARVPLPEWAQQAVQNLIQDRHFSSDDSSAGGYGSTSGRFNMDYTHFLRWRAVRSSLLKNGLRDLPKGKSGRPIAGAAPLTKAALLKQAVASLEGNSLSRHNTGLDQIEVSYRTVEASLAEEEARFRFDLFWEL